MAVDFRGHPMFPPGFNSPTRFEAEVYDCEVWGEIPKDIKGTFYRMQCDFAYRPPENEWRTGFNGDGHLSAFRIENGSVDYIGKYVKTERLMVERKARKRLFGVYRNPYTDDPSVKNVHRSAANTHMYWHGGKLLTLKEDSLPWIVDPRTLDTIGPWDFNGKYSAATMSAHPKVDPMTGEMIAYGYQAKGLLTDDVALYTMNPAGKIVKELWFKAPYVGIMHDCAITPNYFVLPLVPMTTSQQRLEEGHPMWNWDGSYPTMVAVVPRDGGAKDVRWFKGPARMTLHFLNGVEDGNKIHMDLPVGDGGGSPSEFRRWTFNLNSKNDQFEEILISKVNGNLARMDDRFMTQPYSNCFIGDSDPSLPLNTDRIGRVRVTNTWKKVDVATGKTLGTYYVGDVQSLHECSFVPRSRDAAEGDGYLIGVASNYAEMKSDLVIVDTKRMEEGALATVKLPFRLRSGTHTNWYPDYELPLHT